MSYSIDASGYLDLSKCYKGLGCDLFLASSLSKEFYFSELQNLIAWDGTHIINLQYESTWWHLVSRHEMGREKMNPLTHLDLERVKRLPLLKQVLLGNVAADVYKQTNKKGKIDVVQLVIDPKNENYLVLLGLVGNEYIIRSAYPSDSNYVNKVKKRSVFTSKIRP
ncbi:hypothetical protein HMPREF1091_00228 [Atopobium minutum 10063974]|uniref:Phage-Barnase-EndoU-ColicinE5/D-RelE like nuclease 3 domain-containing protein n=2 Tax=Atopobiaceae TaxID=1643824 RepID=N2BVR4_9ACTN|nr:hypothetical protein HMPREF1091_00228 [Atopobium minutum 10063974]